ncbi:MAG: ABC transporter ATP-binding protein [Planctomycetaceae bacterium]|jgi:lipoprotein-releasing system ATP-binding protein|nr:ABC transporter ATP-binding protein [Planctomycetaceae bacterium]
MFLLVSQICKEYPIRSGRLPILRNCSFELKTGQSLSVVGPSGSGKSTLLSILGTLEPANSGSVQLDQVEILSLSERELPTFRRHQIGFIFQEHHLLPQCSSLENVLMPFLAENRRISKEQRHHAISLLERVGLADRLEHRPAELSGGERQRVAIARALVYCPPLLLADEPTGNLDRNNAASIGNLLLQLAETAMLVIATHDPALATRTTLQYQIESETLIKKEADLSNL